MNGKVKKRIYILAGLGADERVFRELDLGDFETTFIQWTPVQPGTSIENYATSLLSQITAPEPVIVGLSFGGIVAVEISKMVPTEKVILISSAKSKKEIPNYFRLMGRLGLHK